MKKKFLLTILKIKSLKTIWQYCMRIICFPLLITQVVLIELLCIIIINSHGMGNHQNIYTRQITSSSDAFLDHLQMIEVRNNFKIWRNKLTSEEFEEYIIQNKQNRTDKQSLEIYQRRRQHKIGLINIHFAESINFQKSESLPYQQFKVFTQRIPITLREVSFLQLSSALQVLKQAFICFDILSKQVGYFDVVEDLIGIDMYNHPKMWLNPCWAQNDLPKNSFIGSYNSIYFQEIMVKKIFQVVEVHMIKQDLAKYLSQKNKTQEWTFQLARNFVNYFMKRQQINQTQQVKYFLKSLQEQVLEFQTLESMKLFQQIDQNISANQNLQQTKPSIQQSSNKSLFDSGYLSFRAPKDKNIKRRKQRQRQIQKQKQKQKQKNQQSSQSIQRYQLFDNTTGLEFKQKFKNKNQTSIDDTQICRSACSNYKKLNQIYDPSQRKLVFIGKQRDLDSSKHSGFKAFTSENFVNTSSDRQQINSNSSCIQRKFQFESIMDKRFESKSVISSSQILKFKTPKESKRILCPQTYLNASHAKIFPINFNLICSNHFDGSSFLPNGFYTPMVKPNNSLSDKILAKPELAFSQIPHKALFQKVVDFEHNKMSQLQFSKSKELKNSQIIAGSNQQLYCNGKPKESWQKKTFLSQSITIDQLIIQPKKNHKPLSLLDMLIAKKAIQKMQGQESEQQKSSRIPNLMVQSIIQPFFNTSRR